MSLPSPLIDTMSIFDQSLLCSSSQDEAVAPIMPAAFWVSQGYDEPTAYSITRFQFQLVERKYIYAHMIHLEPAALNDEHNVPHHCMLIPHWERYMKNLMERGRAKAFFVEKFQLHPSVLEVIVPPLLQMKQLAELGLCKCSIDRNGLLLLSKYLSRNHTLKRLLLNQNQIEDVDAAHALSSAIENHSSMEELCVSQCGLGNNVDVLPELLAGCNRLKILRLNGNNIGSAGVNQIELFLMSNSTLTCLRLDNNSLSDADAPAIAAALKTNTNLQYLHLKGNSFSDDGKRIMTKAVLDETSLNSIADSNHQCEIAHGSPVITSRINEKYWSTKRKVHSKVVLALYGMDNGKSAVQYFNHVPLKFIPHGLELIQTELDCLVQNDATSLRMDSKQSKQLNRMFCFLRVWHMPWIFDNGVT